MVKHPLSTARFLKYVWSFYNIMRERVKIDRPIIFELSDDLVLNSIKSFSQHNSVVKIKQMRTT